MAQRESPVGEMSMPSIVVYSSPFCGYCAAAKALLTRKGADYTEIDVLAAPDRRREMIARSGGRMTVPQIFVGDTHVGGYDDLAALELQGKLDPLLAPHSSNDQRD
jgi:glutaredoxin 3